MATAKHKPLVGLDIGSHSIKLVEIVPSKRGRMLKNFGVIPMPPEAMVEGSIKDRAGVASAIIRLFKNLRVRNSNVAVSLSGYSVIAKKITIERMEESKIEAAIHDEVEKYIPYDVNEINLDFVVLEPTEEFEDVGRGQGESKSRDRMEVLLVAAKRDAIEEYVEVVRAADLNPAVMDADIFALQNAVEISLAGPETCYAIVYLGAAELGLNVVSRGISIFSRDSSYGGAQITEAIRSEFKVDLREAEQMKLGGMSLDAKQSKRLAGILNREISTWVNEIKRTVEFVSSSRTGNPIEKIFVSGGSFKILGVQQRLEAETGIPVIPLNPFKNVVIDYRRFDVAYLDDMALQAGVAVGLSLRSIDDK